MHPAIRTRFHPATSKKISYMSAVYGAKVNGRTFRVACTFEPDLSMDENHQAVCAKLCQHLTIHGDLVPSSFGDDVFWTQDDGAMKALTDMVNSVREATWSGNPWCKPVFREAVAAIGRFHGYHGSELSAPTTPEEVAAFKASR